MAAVVEQRRSLQKQVDEDNKKKMFAGEIWGPDLLAARKIEDSRSEIYGGP